MLNRVVIMGRIRYDLELRKSSQGTSFVMFVIAVDRKGVDSNGERQTDFIDCVAWRHNAEFINKYFVKGQPIAIDGVLQTRQYVDRNGNNRSVTEICVESVSFCGSAPRNNQRNNQRNNLDDFQDSDYFEMCEESLPF